MEAILRVMPLHAITEVYGTEGLSRRLDLELPPTGRAAVASAARWAAELHRDQRRTREPYLNHPLRVTIRMLSRYRVTDPDVLVAGLLHDAVEDQPVTVADIASRHNERAARLVAAVTVPPRPPGADRVDHYVTHLAGPLAGEPWARVIKLSDFTDNGVGLIHSTGPLVRRSARKYEAALPILRDLLDRADTPLAPDVKTHIHRQLDLARERFTAILTG
ncbi:HD domain-containing protein [Actinoplanes sp. NPDC051470]|uniref:HD domain-containing protein n=1 Tax=unclassified Actinoplanes TaxID=2626549 RepID=UPI003422C180